MIKERKSRRMTTELPGGPVPPRALRPGLSKPSLSGQLVDLRPIKPTDLPLIEGWWEEPEANLLDGGDHDGPSYQFRESFRNRVEKGRERNWMLIEGKQDGPVGYVLYRTYNDMPGQAEASLRISRRFWGRGFGGEAFKIFLSHIFHVLQLDRIWLTVYIFNPRAIRLYERLGFKDEEAFIDEKGLEMLRMGIAREDFLRQCTTSQS